MGRLFCIGLYSLKEGVCPNLETPRILKETSKKKHKETKVDDSNSDDDEEEEEEKEEGENSNHE